MNEPHHFQPVHSRHEDIKNQENELFSFEDREPLAAVAGKENNVACPFQQKPDRRLHGASSSTIRIFAKATCVRSKLALKPVVLHLRTPASESQRGDSNVGKV
jgi:hypothetical protein